MTRGIILGQQMCVYGMESWLETSNRHLIGTLPHVCLLLFLPLPLPLLLPLLHLHLHLLPV